ncbi:hypothetical protein KJ765_04170 [Candidatus Micrarchaeota archaeon]|nr:hypothetical protein [Candidatus Micrarchaeota archaeon]
MKKRFKACVRYFDVDLKEKDIRLKKLWKKLNDALLVVEGKHDVAALREVGVYAPVITANGKPERIVQKVIAQARGKPVVLLFDYDREGTRKTLFYNELFFAEDCNADLQPHKQLKQLLPLNTIEDLPTAYYDVMEEIALEKRVRKNV